VKLQQGYRVCWLFLILDRFQTYQYETLAEAIASIVGQSRKTKNSLCLPDHSLTLRAKEQTALQKKSGHLLRCHWPFSKIIFLAPFAF